MLRSTRIPWAKLLLIIVIFLPTLSSAASSTKQEQLDLSILEQSNELLPFMTKSQRITYLKLESAIKEAESDIRSGQNMAGTKPSTFDPDRDLKPIIERGKKLIERAQLRLDAGQTELVALLISVDKQKIVAEAVDETRFDYALETSSYEEAMTTGCQRLLEACWGLGYETTFFDGVYLQDSEGTHPAEAKLRNGVYDTLIKIDGTAFTVTVPVDLQLKADAHGKSSEIFSYENESIFKNDRKVLLAIELIRPEGSSSGVLSLKAIDMKTQLIVAQQVAKVDNMATTLSIEPEGLEDKVPQQVELRDEANTLQTLSMLSTPYAFEIEIDSATMEVAAILAYTLLMNTHLQLADSDFILRAYGDSLDMPEAWDGQANARLTVKSTDPEGSYELSAQADGSDRILHSGTLKLSQTASGIVAEAK